MNGSAGDRKITGHAFELEINSSATAVGNRQNHLGEDFIVLQRSGIGKRKKISRRNYPFASWTHALHLGVKRQNHRPIISGWIGLDQTATDCTAVTHLGIADRTRRLAQYRELFADELGIFYLHMTRHRTQANRTRIFTDVVQISDAMDVDQVYRPRDSELHHRHQALAAGQKLCVVAVPAQEFDRFADTLWR